MLFSQALFFMSILLHIRYYNVLFKYLNPQPPMFTMAIVLY